MKTFLFQGNMIFFRVKEQSTFLFKNFGPELYNDFLIVDNACGDKKDDSKKIDNNNYNINNKIQSEAVEEEELGAGLPQAFLKVFARNGLTIFEMLKKFIAYSTYCFKAIFSQIL